MLAQTAHGQDIEEVIVVGEQTTTETLDDLVSVAAIDGEKLADAGIEDVEDVAAYVPNLVLTQNETGTSIFIRGIGAGVNQGFDQSVGLFSDKVPLPRANMARSPFLDLSNVQVLRGPQYVKDGNFSIAGSVHMISNLSTEEFSSGIDINYVPSQNDRKALFTIGGPISEQFAARLAVQAKRSDGYIENVTRDEGNEQDELVGRLVLGWTPTENLSFKLKAERGSFDNIGRAAEIILDMPSAPELLGERGPDGLFQGISGIDPATGQPYILPGGANAGQVAYRSRFCMLNTGETDFQHLLYLTVDRRLDTLLAPSYRVQAADANDPIAGQYAGYAFVGRSYTEKLAETLPKRNAYSRSRWPAANTR